MIEDRRKVVARAWGLSGPARCQWTDLLPEPVPAPSDRAHDAAVIRNQDLGHQREHNAPCKGVKVRGPAVDSPKN